MQNKEENKRFVNEIMRGEFTVETATETIISILTNSGFTFSFWIGSTSHSHLFDMQNSKYKSHMDLTFTNFEREVVNTLLSAYARAKDSDNMKKLEENMR